MASCKDCLHVEVCKFKGYIRKSERIEKRCGNFKDRSQFVELPCHTGKTAYAFFSDTKANPVISEGVVIGFEITAKRRVLTTICLEDGDTFNGRYEENVFLTKEAAEQALKECE